MSMSLAFELVNGHQVEHQYSEVERRALNPAGASPLVFEVLQGAEATRFGELQGFDVLTGASRAALTGGGAGAVREAHGDTMLFGSSVEQDLYHPEMLVDNDQGAMERVGQTVLEYIVGAAR